MQKENKLGYSVIMPIHNEELYILNALNSVVNQSFLPLELILVNDNSNDKTPFILEEFAKKYPFIKVIESGSTSNDHEPGSKIVHAFYKGFEQLSQPWDILVKLDADVILPTNYFQKIMHQFSLHPKTGIAGGLAVIEREGKWVYENIGNKKQVRGPFKSYSKDCFEKIGGLKKSIGWDTVDELLARYHGFEISVVPELEVKLQKPTGNDYKKIHGERMGNGFYKMDYGLPISMIAALKASSKNKSPKLFFSVLRGYFNLLYKSDFKIVSKEEGKFIRKLRWEGILNRLVNRG